MQVLLNNSNEVRLFLSAKMNAFLKEFYDYSTLTLSGRTSSTTLLHPTIPEPPSHLNKKNVCALLNVVSYLRRQPLPPHLAPTANNNKARPAWEENFWIADLNYLHVAKAALTCSAYLSALLYSEIWWGEESLHGSSNQRQQAELKSIMLAASLRIGNMEAAAALSANLRTGSSLVLARDDAVASLKLLPMLDIQVRVKIVYQI